MNSHNGLATAKDKTLIDVQDALAQSDTDLVLAAHIMTIHKDELVAGFSNPPTYEKAINTNIGYLLRNPLLVGKTLLAYKLAFNCQVTDGFGLAKARIASDLEAFTQLRTE